MLRCEMCGMNLDPEMNSCPGCGASTGISASGDERLDGDDVFARVVIKTTVADYDVVACFGELPKPMDIVERMHEGGLWIEPGEHLWVAPSKLVSVQVKSIHGGMCTMCGAKLVEMCPACKE